MSHPDDLIYHFTTYEHGLQALRQKRLKVALLDELNDPFEFKFAGVSESAFPEFFSMGISGVTGIVCFSYNDTHPLMWRHYADKHQGMCLGFRRIPGSTMRYHDVDYPKDLKRVVLDDEVALDDLSVQAEDYRMQQMMKAGQTKHRDWKYEEEVRAILTLDVAEEQTESEKKSGLYFASFQTLGLELKTVVIGVRAKRSGAPIIRAYPTAHAEQLAIGFIELDTETFKLETIPLAQ